MTQIFSNIYEEWNRNCEVSTQHPVDLFTGPLTDLPGKNLYLEYNKSQVFNVTIIIRKPYLIVSLV